MYVLATSVITEDSWIHKLYMRAENWLESNLSNIVSYELIISGIGKPVYIEIVDSYNNYLGEKEYTLP